MLSNSSPSLIHFLLVVVGTAFLIYPATATDHIVGANKGWNPGINYTDWANNQTFYVGDYISFRYKKFEYNVFEVNKTGYDNCTIEGAAGNWSNGKDFVHLNKTGRYYFICGTGGCTSGMKVSIVVHSIPPPPSASIAATKHSSESTKHASAASEMASGRLLLVVLRTLLVGLVSSILTR
ncbi:lamin-like protein [Chenopodium quinoa]|uniref:Phytocyanin domain-containing protein n=1 Tax=Chenopodium quinoa TaxID=63459 RepID=A0A803LE58_CHEQI|nr:lamin-like protein [Chenopodium quinoa]